MEEKLLDEKGNQLTRKLTISAPRKSEFSVTYQGVNKNLKIIFMLRMRKCHLTSERTTWRKYLEECSTYIEISTIHESS